MQKYGCSWWSLILVQPSLIWIFDSEKRVFLAVLVRFFHITSSQWYHLFYITSNNVGESLWSQKYYCLESDPRPTTKLVVRDKTFDLATQFSILRDSIVDVHLHYILSFWDHFNYQPIYIKKYKDISSLDAINLLVSTLQSPPGGLLLVLPS